MGLLRRRIIVISAFAWLPLFLLSLWQEQLWGGVAIPFLKDIEVHIRLLVVIPLLIGAELLVHQRMRPILSLFLERNLIAEKDLPRFHGAIKSAMRLRNSVIAEIALIAFVYIVGVFIVWQNYTSISVNSWHSINSDAGWKHSAAGLWYGYVSVPIFQFLLLRWYFRIFIWAWFLWKISRLVLQLVPSHPDRSGGLGFLSGIVYAFVPLLTAHGAMLAGLIAGRIFYLGESLTDFKIEIAAMVVFLICLVQGPLLVFVPQLEEAKRQGKRKYGDLSEMYTRAFEQRWIETRGNNGQELLGNADIQSLADLANAYDTVQSMRLTLTSRDAILTLAAAIVAPIIPLALTMMPLEELAMKLLGILF